MAGTPTRETYYREPIERTVRLDSGPLCVLTTPSDITALNDKDRAFLEALLDVFTTYRRPPGAHRVSRSAVFRG